MKLKNKIGLTLILISFIYIVGSYFVQKYYITNLNKKIEISESIKYFNICRSIVRDEVKRIQITCTDWSTWDSAYNFVQGKNRNEFIKVNLPPSILDDVKLDFISFYDINGNIVWKKTAKQSGPGNNFFKDLDKKLKANHLLFTPIMPNSPKSGILYTKYGFLLLVTSPIMKSDNTGPCSGTTCMGIFYPTDFLESIAAHLGVDFKLYSIAHSPEQIKEKADSIISKGKKYSYKFESGNTIKSYFLVNDITGTLNLIAVSNLNLVSLKRSGEFLYYSTLSTAAAGIIFIAIVSFLIQFNVLSPISKLVKTIKSVKTKRDFSIKVPCKIKRNDELSFLYEEFNSLLSKTDQLVNSMECTIKDRTNEIKEAREETILRLASAVESKDNDTGNHIYRLREIAKFIAAKLNFDSITCERIGLASTLHDIGKIGIPDSILKKPEKLTKEEFDQIKTHTTIGRDILSHSKSELISLAKNIALYHHERWDGTGYPEGIKGKDIPIAVRITTVADVFDALLSKRAYKKNWSCDDALNFLMDNSGKIFDPNLVEVVSANIEEILKIRAKVG